MAGEVRRMGQEIFILAEQKEGTIQEPSFSLLSEGKRLKEKLGTLHSLSAILVGHGMKDLESELGSHGADRVYYFDHPLLEKYQPDLYTGLIAEWVREKNPDLFLLGATALGRDLAPRIAARLRVGLVTHCVDILIDCDRVTAVKPVSDQYLYQRVAFRSRGPKMLTFAVNAMAKDDPDLSRRAEVIKIPPEMDEKRRRVRFMELIKADPKTIGLEEADRIVCGGRGVGKGTFEVINQLADALNGSVGGTRPVIDWGILPYERQIGQTGIEVSPTLLMTFGISGANEFTVGMEGSKLVIAINMDRKARIFKFADLGIIGDLHKIIPLLIDQVKKQKQTLPARLSPSRGEGLGGGESETQ
jgi:electron transfer flavoprotein alpha subunit